MKLGYFFQGEKGEFELFQRKGASQTKHLYMHENLLNMASLAQL